MSTSSGEGRGPEPGHAAGRGPGPEPGHRRGRAKPWQRPGHVANIGARGARRRAIGGVVWLAVAIAASAWLTGRHARGAAFALVAIPYFLAAISWLQARERT